MQIHKAAGLFPHVVFKPPCGIHSLRLLCALHAEQRKMLWSTLLTRVQRSEDESVTL